MVSGALWIGDAFLEYFLKVCNCNWVTLGLYVYFLFIIETMACFIVSQRMVLKTSFQEEEENLIVFQWFCFS